MKTLAIILLHKEQKFSIFKPLTINQQTLNKNIAKGHLFHRKIYYRSFKSRCASSRKLPSDSDMAFIISF